MVPESRFAFIPSHPAERIWPLVLTVAGCYWLFLAVAEILLFWQFAGKEFHGLIILNWKSRILTYVLDYCASVVFYRVALSVGWPRGFLPRVKAAGLQLLLAVLFYPVSTVASMIATGLTHGDWQLARANFNDAFEFQWGVVLWAWSQGTPKYVMGLLVVGSVNLLRKYHEESLRLSKLSQELSSTQLAMLSAQLQPHFLFNSMHVITELIHVDPTRATEMVARLGDFLRHALETSRQSRVTLEAELDGVAAYLSVQQARFGERLQVHFNVNPAAAACSVPSLLLQPLIENAVDYGCEGSLGPLQVGIFANLDHELLRIEVTNSTPRLPKRLSRESYGYGLRNVELRLSAAYGPAASLEVGPDPVSGTRVTLTMPAHIGPRESLERSSVSTHPEILNVDASA